MKTSFYKEDELKQLGLNSYGENVLISRLCSIYGAACISIGSNVRIDDFVVISVVGGELNVGNYVHFGPGVTIIGRGTISIGNFVGLSAKASVFSASDDYSGNSLLGMHALGGSADNFRNLIIGHVSIGDHVVLGASSVILPDVKIARVVSIGANSLVTKDCDSFGIYAGTPAKRIKEKSKRCLELEESFRGLDND